MIQLYKKGTQVEIRGLMVDILNCTDIYGSMKLGWCLTPEDAYKEKEIEESIESTVHDVETKPKKRGRPPAANKE